MIRSANLTLRVLLRFDGIKESDEYIPDTAHKQGTA